jgi:MATE family multidrug resistance protein
MSTFITRRSHLRRTFALALPVAVVQMGMHTLSVADTVMAGQVSEEVLAGVGMGGLYAFMVLIFGMGGLLVLDPLVSQAHGAGDRESIALAVQRGLLLAVVFSVPAALALIPAEQVLAIAQQPPSVCRDAGAYARITAPGILPFFGFVVLRQTLQALHRLRPIVIAIVVANVLNLFLNWVLIFGNLGVPAMGVEGAAWASTIGRWFLLIALIVLDWKHLAPALRPFRRAAADRAALLKVLRIGLPIGFTLLAEFSAFTIIALLMGALGVTELAAHQVAINLAALTYMVPLGISGAATVLVGNSIGKGRPDDARRFTGAALLLGGGFMVFSCATFIAIPGVLADGYSNDAEVIAMAVILLPLAGVFQVVDGLQVVAAGALRGAADTRAPLWIGLASFWFVGLPISFYFGIVREIGPRGLWWGLVAALATGCVLMLARLILRFRRDLTRTHVDTVADTDLSSQRQ